MRRIVSLCAVLLLCCDDKPDAAEATKEAASEAAAASDEPADPLVELKDAIKEVVAMGEADDAKRRTECIPLAKQVQEIKAGEKKKRDELLASAESACPEIFATQRVLEKAGGPKAQLELSGALASMFTSKDLKAELKRARRLVKRKKDPKDACGKVRVITSALEKRKKQRRKVKKLMKRALEFCSGRAARATVVRHLEQAETAARDKEPHTLAEHCVHAILALQEAAPGAKRAPLETRASTLCIEAAALRPIAGS